MKNLFSLILCLVTLLTPAACSSSKSDVSSESTSDKTVSTTPLVDLSPENFYFSFDSLEELIKAHNNGYSKHFKEMSLVKSEEEVLNSLKSCKSFNNKALYFPTHNGNKMTLKGGFVWFDSISIMTTVYFNCIDSNNDEWQFTFFYYPESVFSKSDLSDMSSNSTIYEWTLQTGEKAYSYNAFKSHVYFIESSPFTNFEASTSGDLGNYCELFESEFPHYKADFGLEKIADPSNTTQK